MFRNNRPWFFWGSGKQKLMGSHPAGPNQIQGFFLQFLCHLLKFPKPRRETESTGWFVLKETEICPMEIRMLHPRVEEPLPVGSPSGTRVTSFEQTSIREVLMMPFGQDDQNQFL